LHRFLDINTYLPKIKTSRDLENAHLGTVCHHETLVGPTRAQNLTILSSAIPDKFKGV